MVLLLAVCVSLEGTITLCSFILIPVNVLIQILIKDVIIFNKFKVGILNTDFNQSV